MNVDTGELRRLSAEEFKEIDKTFFKDFVPVPDTFQKEADTLLGDKDSVMVDMTQNTPLVNWSKKKKAEKDKKAKRKIAEASRKRNRREHQ